VVHVVKCPVPAFRTYISRRDELVNTPIYTARVGRNDALMDSVVPCITIAPTGVIAQIAVMSTLMRCDVISRTRSPSGVRRKRVLTDWGAERKDSERRRSEELEGPSKRPSEVDPTVCKPSAYGSQRRPVTGHANLPED
jgi:hypothetical protein